MPVLSVEVELSVSPQQVWAALIDFETYEQWHPYQTITGKAKPYAILRVVSRKLNSQTVQSRSRTVILRFESYAAFEFGGGFPLFSSRRWFHLEPTSNGTLLRHGISFSGWMADRAFRKTHKIERFQPFLDAFSKALARHLEGPKPPRPKISNRKTRRAAQAKQR